MSSPVDHVAAMTALLPSQYRKLPGVLAWVTALGNRLNEIDSSLNDMVNLTPLSTAFGAQLDGWGQILETPRESLNDTNYRIFLYERLSGFNSQGTIPELEAIFSTMLGISPVAAYEPYMAEFWMDTDGVPAPIGDITLIGQAVKAGKPAGVALFLLMESALPYFGFAEDTNPESAGFTDSTGIPGGTFAQTL